MLVFWDIWCTLFSCYLRFDGRRFDGRSFALLPTPLLPNLIISFALGLNNKMVFVTFRYWFVNRKNHMVI